MDHSASSSDQPIPKPSPAEEKKELRSNSRVDVRPLRVWPASLLLVTLWILKLVLPYADSSMPALMMTRFFGPLVCAGLILLWWLLLSRASMREKTFGILGLVSIATFTTLLADKSMPGAGTMLYAVPWGITGFTLALICLARRLSLSRTGFSLLAALVCFGFWDLVRIDDCKGGQWC